MDPDIQAALDQFLTALQGSSRRRVVIVQLWHVDGTCDTIAVPQGPPPAPPDHREPRPSLRTLIVDALAASDRPLKAAGIARRLGRKNSSSFRECLRQLVQDGEVVEHPGYTYWLPKREGQRPGK